MDLYLPPLLNRSNSAKLLSKNKIHDQQSSKKKISQVAGPAVVIAETHRDRKSKRTEDNDHSLSHRRFNSDVSSIGQRNSQVNNQNSSKLLISRQLQKPISNNRNTGQINEENSIKTSTLLQACNRIRLYEAGSKQKKTQKTCFPADFFANLVESNEINNKSSDIGKKSQRKIVYPSAIRPAQKAYTAEGSSRKLAVAKKQSNGEQGNALDEIFEEGQKFVSHKFGSPSKQKSVESSTDVSSSWNSKLNYDQLEPKQEEYKFPFGVSSCLLNEETVEKNLLLTEFKKSPSLPNEMSSNSIPLFTFYPAEQKEISKKTEVFAPKGRNTVVRDSTNISIKFTPEELNKFATMKKLEAKRVNSFRDQSSFNDYSNLHKESRNAGLVKWFSEKKSGKDSRVLEEFKIKRDAEDVSEFSFCDY